jgi:predicted RNA-binding protein with PIN domain
VRELLIIDGYNFIFNFFQAGKLSTSQIEEIKEKLVTDLSAYNSQKDYEVIVVFDAHKGTNMERSSNFYDDIKVIHSRRGETADSVIEELVARWSSDRRIVVVTSDYSQQKVVFGKNTTRRSSREFGLELEAVRNEIAGMVDKEKKKTKKAFYPIEKRIDSKTRKKISDLRKK